MHTVFRGFTIVGLAAILAACAGAASAPTPATMTANAARASVRDLCPPVPPGFARCDAAVQIDAAPSAFVGYGPSDLQSAYRLGAAAKKPGQLVAIVDAYDDPHAEADVGLYRQEYELPQCTTTNGCFKKINQHGVQGNYPAPNVNWAGEASIDLDMVSAICPQCSILLVEADSNSIADLSAAVDEAVLLGAHVVNNSYGGVGGDSSASHYKHKGVVFVASSGDNLGHGGYGYYGFKNVTPAAFPTVVAVGGTTLRHFSNGAGREWTEYVWYGTGSGCSSLPQPKWQRGLMVGCKGRVANDVAAIADPSMGVAVYDSYAQSGSGGWGIYGGTSVAAAITSGVFALAGNAAKVDGARSFYQKRNRKYLNDITFGTNAMLCTPAYLCVAEPLYDGPTGWGTPNGLKAF